MTDPLAELDRESWRQLVWDSLPIAKGRPGENSLRSCLLCSEDYMVLSEDGRSLEFNPFPCSRKICPDCLVAWSEDLQKKTIRVVRDLPPRELRHLVLTIPNVPFGDLPSGIQKLYKVFREWRNQGRRKAHGNYWKCVDGYAWKLEVKPSGDGRTWHPHIHCLLHVPRGFDLQEGSHALTAWKRLGRTYFDREVCSPWITKVGNKIAAAQEVAKYATKPALLCEMSTYALAELADSVHGVRFTHSSGTLEIPPDPDGNSGKMFIGTIREFFHAATAADGPVKKSNGIPLDPLHIVHVFAKLYENCSHAHEVLPEPLWEI